MPAKLKLIASAIILMTLNACTEAPKQATTQKPQATTTANIEGPFTPPTMVPNTQVERQDLLEQLQQKSDVQSKRLSLFVRYTTLTSTKVEQAALEQLISDIDTLLKTTPDDHELRALFGSATSLKAIFYLDDVGQTNLLAKKGGRQLDRAVKKAPNHLGVRLYRGITYAEMPEFLGKARFAQQDFEVMTKALDKNTDPNYLAMVNYYYSMSMIKNNQKQQAKGLLQQVINNKRAPWDSRAKDLLKEAG